MKRFLLLIAAALIVFSFKSINVQDEVWIAPDSAKDIENNVAEKKRASSSKKGGKAYAQRCAFCHGGEGKGDGAAAGRLSPKPANLTSEMVQIQTDGEIFWKLSQGRGSMPKWESILSEDERWDLVNFIRTLSEE